MKSETTDFSLSSIISCPPSGLLPTSALSTFGERVFHSWLETSFSRVGYPLVRYLRQRKPENPNLAKAEGMFRFTLEGKRPLADQPWPEALADQKAALLSSR